MTALLARVADVFGFDRIDPAATERKLAAIRNREAAADAALALQRGWHARMVADGLIREPGCRTREGDAAANTFAAAGMGDIADMLRGVL